MHLSPVGSLTYSASRSMVRWRSINLVISPATFPEDDGAAPPVTVYEPSRSKQYDATSQRQYLTDHIQFINHRQKQILLIDLSNCSAAEVTKIFRAVPEFVTVRPRDSILILSDFTGAAFDPEAVRVMKEAAVFDKPYVKRSAWLGTENFPKAFAEVSSFSRREFPVFETRKEALAWLAED
jgi:hypothetical protein